MVEGAKGIRATVTIEERINAELLGRLKEANYLLLREETNAEIMKYAMAVGWESRLPVPLSRPHSGGWARTESFTPEMNMLIKLLHFEKIGFDSPDGLRKQNEGLDYVEEYANGGFNIIEGDLDDKLDSETKANMIIADLDNRYRKLFPASKVDYQAARL